MSLHSGPYSRNVQSRILTQIGETYGTDTFYGNHAASSFGSIVTLEWLGQPYRLSRINLPEDAQSDLYIQLNPARKVPLLLLENGTRLSESAAILQHLAWRDPSKGLTFAQGTPEYDHLNQVLAFVNTDYWSSFAPAFKAFDMDLTGEKDPPVQKMLREFGGEAHAALEAMMGDREWLAGDRRTIADTYFAGIARSVPFLASTGAEDGRFSAIIRDSTSMCRSWKRTRPSFSPTPSKTRNPRRAPVASKVMSRWKT